MALMSAVLVGASVLMIGDSHLSKPDYLIKSLHDELTLRGAVVHSVSACGVTASDWINSATAVCGAERRAKAAAALTGKETSTQPVKALIAADKAKFVIVVMGDTMASYKNEFASAWVWKQVSSLSKEIASTGATCIWVGPPWGEGGQYGKTQARVQQISNFLATTVAPCLYIDSLKLSQPSTWPTTDGQHLLPSGYLAWGKAVAKRMDSLSIPQ